MKGEVWCKENLNLNGKVYYREAVRAIIKKGKKLLLVRSGLNGDYKFPGGGVEEGESYYEALIREVKEEVGANVLKVEEYGEIIEYDEGQADGVDVFKMLSKYYIVQIEDKLHEPILDNFEKKLKFEPVWIELERAYRENLMILESPNPPRWTKRETYALEILLKKQ